MWRYGRNLTKERAFPESMGIVIENNGLLEASYGAGKSSAYCGYTGHDWR